MPRAIFTIAVATSCVSVAPRLMAQKPVIQTCETKTTAVTILRMDPTARCVVVDGDDGSDMGLFVPPEFARLNHSRVGALALCLDFTKSVSLSAAVHKNPPRVGVVDG